MRARRFAPLLVVLAVAGLAASCTTPVFTPPPQSQANIQIKANTLHVIAHNNDGFGISTWDEPYLINLDFRAQFNTANSAATFVVENTSNELTCPGGPNGGLFGINGNISCSNGESSAVPNAMGLNQFPAMKIVDVTDLLYGYQPEVAGDFTFAYEEDQIFGSGNVAATVASFATALKNVLNSTVATGSLPADGNAAASLIVSVIGTVALSFIGNTILGLLSGLGNADDLIGIAPVIVVGISGTLASLANAAGLSGTAVLNGVVDTIGTFNHTLTYTKQTVGGFDLGDAGTNYTVDWTVGGY